MLEQLKQSDVRVDLHICNSSLNVGKITEVWQTCFTVDWNSEVKCYFWERDNRVIGELAIAPQVLIEKFLEENHQSCLNCPSCESPLLILNDGCGVCGWTPENFLEESERTAASAQKPKGRQHKGCLYKYIENKKLKNGSIASYPRVIGHRQPDNPTHWRWGFNWEEKIDGEWKGRSIGSVPVGAIALIQSMQNEGVSLEKIIDFIRRAKSKKS